MKKALLLIIATIFSATAQAQLLSTYSSLSTIDTTTALIKTSLKERFSNVLI
jgi:hypothetical protein